MHLNSNYTDICFVKKAKSYLLSALLLAYSFSMLGVPVYFHYCDGTLEQINILSKGKTCCSDDSGQDSDAMDCCKDEQIVLKGTNEALLKPLEQLKKLNACDVLVLPVGFLNLAFRPVYTAPQLLPFENPPPNHRLQLISTFVLRI
ncbi:MAG TPA: hypothetical protein PLQ93_08785 [Bacteroidia bacterium]|nr:hypothetical protein [Bacteroidia bacterium]